jgi:hypothetical protein
LTARYAANAPSKLELPAPACVCALFVAGALTKYGHPELAIGATIFRRGADTGCDRGKAGHD